MRFNVSLWTSVVKEFGNYLLGLILLGGSPFFTVFVAPFLGLFFFVVALFVLLFPFIFLNESGVSRYGGALSFLDVRVYLCCFYHLSILV